jgi:ActR/RegA family two-component response regulator
LAPVRLLLVDDDEALVSALKVILEAHDFEVTTALSVVEALRLITAQPFDVLLSDLHMPDPGDGLIVVGAMRRANPRSVTVVVSANPDMAKASAAILRETDEIFLKPPKIVAIVQAIRQRLVQDEELPSVRPIESIAAMLTRERQSITQAWLAEMASAGTVSDVPPSSAERSADLPDALTEILYRLRYPQPLGAMTLFSMTSLQHGARRRRQGFLSPVLVQEYRALQTVLFTAIQNNLDHIDLGQLPTALMAIADEINAQLLQCLSGYENEKTGVFASEDD